MDLPRRHTIRESSRRIADASTDAQPATLGRVLHLTPGTRGVSAPVRRT